MGLQGVPGLTDPSKRPNEPVTAGLPMGEGPGPEALREQRVRDVGLLHLRALIREHPNEMRDAMRLLAFAEMDR